MKSCYVFNYIPCRIMFATTHIHQKRNRKSTLPSFNDLERSPVGNFSVILCVIFRVKETVLNNFFSPSQTRLTSTCAFLLRTLQNREVVDLRIFFTYPLLIVLLTDSFTIFLSRLFSHSQHFLLITLLVWGNSWPVMMIATRHVYFKAWTALCY